MEIELHGSADSVWRVVQFLRPSPRSEQTMPRTPAKNRAGVVLGYVRLLQLIDESLDRSRSGAGSANQIADEFFGRTNLLVLDVDRRAAFAPDAVQWRQYVPSDRAAAIRATMTGLLQRAESEGRVLWVTADWDSIDRTLEKVGLPPHRSFPESYEPGEVHPTEMAPTVMTTLINLLKRNSAIVNAM